MYPPQAGLVPKYSQKPKHFRQGLGQLAPSEGEASKNVMLLGDFLSG